MASTSKHAFTAGPAAFRSNDGDKFTSAQLVELADKVNAHVSILAPVSGVPLDEWNAMCEDFQAASQLLVGIANTDDFIEAFTVAHETGLTPRQLKAEREWFLSKFRELRTALLADHGHNGDLSEASRMRAVSLVRATIAKTGGAA